MSATPTADPASLATAVWPFAPVEPARPALVKRAVSDGLRIGLGTGFSPAVSQLMRELGCAWSAPRRLWVTPTARMASLLTDLEARAGLVPDWDIADVRTQAAAAWRTPCRSYFAEVLDVQLMPLQRGFALTSAFDPLVSEAARSLSGRFHRHARAWEIQRPRGAILEALARLAGIDAVYVFEHEAQMQLEDLVGGGSSALPITVPGAAPPAGSGMGAGTEGQLGAGFLSALGSEMQRLPIDEAALADAARLCGLRDYQVGGVRHLLGLSSALLADDMGLGKTRQAVVASRLAAGSSIVLVVCPASLAINWQREILAVYPEARVAMVGEHDLAAQRSANWVIANYERLGGLVRETSMPIGCMVIDEAHYLKEHEAGRTRNAFVLSQRVPRRFLLTGTPLLSREIEVHTLLRLSGHALGDMPLGEFRKAFAGNEERRALLASRVSEWMLRRGKDVLKDLGDKTHQVRHIRAADGLAGYRAIHGDKGLMAMPKITKLRQHLEQLKLDFLIEAIQSLPQDAKAIVFCEYMDTVEALRQAMQAVGIGCVSLVGSDAPKKRMKAVDAFQQDPATRVFIGTTQAAGVGITLTAANYVFFASLPWTPALKRQAEDRAYRSGQTRDVFVIIPLVVGTIDEQIFALLEAKREIEVSVVEVNRAAVTG